MQLGKLQAKENFLGFPGGVRLSIFSGKRGNFTFARGGYFKRRTVEFTYKDAFPR